MSGPSNPFATPSGMNPQAAGYAPSQEANGDILLLPPAKEPSVSPSALAAYQYVFKDPNGFAAVLALGLCALASGFIPIVPQIVMIGYLAYMAESLIRRPSAPALKFDFDHLSKYLGRGIWGFLTSIVAALVAAVPLTFLIFVIYLVLALIAAAVGSQAEAAGVIVFVIGMILTFVVSMLCSVFVSLFVNTIQFRSMMAGSFGAGFDFGWIKDFLSKVGMKLFTGLLVWALLAFVVSLLGMLLLCVGLYFAQGWIMLAMVHYLCQVYRLYLSQGGMPIAMKPEVTLDRLTTA